MEWLFNEFARQIVLQGAWRVLTWTLILAGAFLHSLGLGARQRPIPTWGLTTFGRARFARLLGLFLIVIGAATLSYQTAVLGLLLVTLPLLLSALFVLATIGSFGMVLVGLREEAKRAQSLRARVGLLRIVGDKAAPPIGADMGAIVDFLRDTYRRGRWQALDWRDLYPSYSRWGEEANLHAPPRPIVKKLLKRLPASKENLPCSLEFLDTQCRTGARESIESEALFDAYLSWAERCGATPYTKRDFAKVASAWTGARQLGALWHLFEKKRLSNRCWVGVCLVRTSASSMPVALWKC